eukprot:2506793-Amphidinium_carterae.1
MHACRKIAPLLPLLRATWDAEKYREHLEKSPKNETGINPEDIADILNNDMFAAYMHMILLISEAFGTLSAWAEGCVCHDDELRGTTTSQQQKRMRTQYPQLPHWASYENALSASDWAVVQTDFTSAKAFMHSVLHVKLNFLTCFPWRLAALVHHDASVRRLHAVQAMSEYDALAEEEKQRLPKASRAVFETDLRENLSRFAETGEFEGLEALANVLLPWKFVLTSERYVEASHSLVKRMVPHSHSPVLVSLTRRLPRFEMHIALAPQHLQE